MMFGGYGTQKSGSTHGRSLGCQQKECFQLLRDPTSFSIQRKSSCQHQHLRVTYRFHLHQPSHLMAGPILNRQRGLCEGMSDFNLAGFTFQTILYPGNGYIVSGCWQRLHLLTQSLPSKMVGVLPNLFLAWCRWWQGFHMCTFWMVIQTVCRL